MTLMSGRMTLVATAIDPLHHGAGSAGNTQLLRMQEIVLPDGTPARVPFVSGNSIKHLIREGGVRFALEAMGVGQGVLTKAVVDLLFSGGHLSKAGQAVNLGQARQIAELFPILAVCGYSAGNFIQESKISVGNLNLVCAENQFRLPADLREDARAQQRAARFRGEEFGTRHEATRNPMVFGLLTEAEQDRRTKQISGNLEAGARGKGDSSQMYYEYEVLVPGSALWGSIYFAELTVMEVAALRSALERACLGTHADGGMIYTVGAKAAVGLGRVSIRFTGDLRETLSPPTYSPAEAIMPIDGDQPNRDAMAAYVAHLREQRERILKVLEEAIA
jgi:hypothetical protein